MLLWIVIFLGAWFLITCAIYLWYTKTTKSIGSGSYDDLERLNHFDGDFKYLNDGFYLSNLKSINIIKRSEITAIIAKPILFDDDSLHYSIFIKVNNDYTEIKSSIPGFQKFALKIKENLAIADCSWQWKLHSKVEGVITVYETLQNANTISWKT